MKKTFPLIPVVLSILSLFMLTNIYSQTHVSGDQTGVWTTENSPYLVTGNITVPNNLEIEPGVTVNFQGNYQFIVNGNLQAVGTETDSIYFTTDNPATGWGGVRVDSDDIINLSYCRIEFGKTSGDYPDIHGGGLALLTSNAIVSNCVFADNDATGQSNGMGGAVYAINTGTQSETLTRFTDCKFIRNHAYGEGGAIKFTSDGHTEITGCEFIQNDANYGGGAINCYSVMGTKITNCLFFDNYTMYSSGGALNTLGMGNYLYFVNCTIVDNSAVTGDGGAVNLAYAEAYFVNTIVYDNPGMYSDDINADWGSTVEVFYSNMTMPSEATGYNNIETNPLFVNPAVGDYSLQEDSPCIDAGVAYFAANGETLLDLNESEFSGESPDMGAFEFGFNEVMSVDVDYIENWTMIGLPLNVGNPDYLTLFPDAVEGTLYSFDYGYHPENNLTAGNGYWLRFETAGTAMLEGQAITTLTLDLTDGWNLISGISTVVNVSDISDPEGLIIPGTVYGFGSNGYSATETIEPGKGYWLRSNGAGEITLINGNY